jgi:ribosomal protein L1
MIGKISWESKKLEENLKAVIEAIRQYNPVSVTICTTMSPGIKVVI